MTAIEWTDATWNPVTGCDRVSPGCANCYALTLARRLKAMGQPGYQRDGGRASGPGFGVTLHPHKLDEPLRWRKPRRVFVNSMSDLFHEEVPDEFIFRVLLTMREASQHTFQVLTKRPERARDLLTFWYRCEGALALGEKLDAVSLPSAFRGYANVWLGVSIENARFTWRADVLRQIPAAVRFISAEPLLGSLFKSGPGEDERPSLDGGREPRNGRKVAGARTPLDLTGIDWVIIGGEPLLGSLYDRSSDGDALLPGRATPGHADGDPVGARGRGTRSSADGDRDRPDADVWLADPTGDRVRARRAPLDLSGIDWVIIGGESGPGARPFHLEHAREIVSACKEHAEQPAVFVKQLGAAPFEHGVSLRVVDPYGPTRPIRDRKGGDPDEWPADLRIREFPRSGA